MKKKPLLLWIGVLIILIFVGFIYWLKIKPDSIKKYCKEYANQEYKKKFGEPYPEIEPPYPVCQNTLNF